MSRLSQTADDLRNRLGLRGSAAGRGRAASSRRGSRTAARDYYGPADYGEDAIGGNGYGGDGSATAGAAAGAAAAGRNGYSGARRTGGHRAPGYGEDYGDGPANGRTALRDQPDDFWSDGEQTSRGLRSRVTERTGLGHGGGRRGGGGGGDGRDGRGGGDPRGRGHGFKNWLLYGSWWRHWTWKKALGVLGIGFAAFCLLLIAGFFIVYSMTPIPSAHSELANYQSSSVYLPNGKLLGTFSDQGMLRQQLASSQIPTDMQNAMIAAEDRNFYHEGGVSLTGIMRAAYEDIFGSGGEQGGSTLTEQYAKNYYTSIGASRTVTTKLKEIFISIKLAHSRSKLWILTNYLNEVPFGGNVYGVGAAAETYFGIDLTKPGATLSISQAAMLAAMPNEPGVFTPDPNGGAGYTGLVERWNYVIINMLRDNAITQQQANALCESGCTLAQQEQKFNQTVDLHSSSNNGWSGTNGYLMNMVLQQLEAPAADGGYGLTEQQVDTGGYRITTTFSMAKMRALATSVNQEKAQMKADGQRLPSYDHIGAVLEDSKTGAIVAIYGGPGMNPNCKDSCDLNNAEIAEPVGSSFKPYVLATAVHEGMSVLTSKLNGFSPIWIPEAPADKTSTELALSPTSPPSGVSSSAVGGYGPNGIYYFKFEEAGENYGKGLAVNYAAAVSSDSAFEDLAHRDGVDSVIQMAKALGVGQTAFVEPCTASASATTIAQTIADCNDMTGVDNGLWENFSADTTSKTARANGTPGSPAIALGENPLTPIEQASTFATLADGGVYHTPHVIQTLQQGSTTVKNNLQTQQVLTTAQAADVDWALSFDNNMIGGTADGSISYRRGDVIGKTGTLGSGAFASQAWFVGATPDAYAMSVALFTNDPATQNLDNLPYTGGNAGSYGGAWPASIWNNYFSSEFNNAPYVPLAQTTDVGFSPWIQVLPAKKKTTTCGHGQGHGNFGQPCTGNGTNPNPNPNPTVTCQFGQCGTTTTTPPGQPCTGFGCTSTSPPASPSPGTSGAAMSTGGNAATTAAVELPAEETAYLTVYLSTARLGVAVELADLAV